MFVHCTLNRSRSAPNRHAKFRNWRICGAAVRPPPQRWPPFLEAVPVREPNHRLTQVCGESTPASHLHPAKLTQKMAMVKSCLLSVLQRRVLRQYCGTTIGRSFRSMYSIGTTTEVLHPVQARSGELCTVAFRFACLFVFLLDPATFFVVTFEPSGKKVKRQGSRKSLRGQRVPPPPPKEYVVCCTESSVARVINTDVVGI